MLKTPKDALTFIMTTALLYLSAPFFIAWYFYEALFASDFPPESDAIAIPIAGFAFLCLLALPFALAFLCVAARDYPGAVSVFAFNEKRPIWSFCWSLLFAGLAFFCLFDAANYFLVSRWSNFFVGLHAIFDAYVLLCFGASISYSKIFKRNKFL